MVDSRIPPGASLLLIGSGLYWILSSQLISSFTVLTPGLFQANALGASLITVVGIVSATTGLWMLQVDFDELRSLFSRRDGWIFTVPVALVAADVYLTLIVLSTNSQIVELNPFVSSAIARGAPCLGSAKFQRQYEEKVSPWRVAFVLWFRNMTRHDSTGISDWNLMRS